MALMALIEVSGPVHRAVPDEFRNGAAAFGLRQSWPMFTYEGSTDGWFNVAGDTAGAGEVDLLSDEGGAVQWQPRRVPASHYPSARWEQFLYARGHAESRNWEPYARWLCRRWNEARPAPAERLERVRIVFMHKGADALGLPAYRRVVLLDRPCGD
jgi:hypothetical protein